MNSILCMQATRSLAPTYAMAWETSALTQVDAHGVAVVAAFAQALPAAVRTRGGAAPHPRGIPV